MFFRAILVTGVVLAVLPASMAADPAPQGKGLETIRYTPGNGAAYQSHYGSRT